MKKEKINKQGINRIKERKYESWLKQRVRKLYGKKCPDYEPGCACCQAWNIYTTIIDAKRGRL